MKHVVYRTKDGRVLRTAPAPDSRLMLFDAEGDIRGERWETDQEVAERVAATLPPGTPYRIIDESQPTEAAGFSMAVDVAERRADAKRAIDSAAEQARRRYITPGDGMALVYEAKRSEAEKWIERSKAGGAVMDAALIYDFPLIAAECRRSGRDPELVAGDWKRRSDAWMGAAAAIETIRLHQKAEVDESANEGEIDAVVAEARAQLSKV